MTCPTFAVSVSIARGVAMPVTIAIRFISSKLVLGKSTRRCAGAGGCEVHNPGYDFNDEALPLGASVLARIVETKLAR